MKLLHGDRRLRQGKDHHLQLLAVICGLCAAAVTKATARPYLHAAKTPAWPKPAMLLQETAAQPILVVAFQTICVNWPACMLNPGLLKL
jgi:hypothetical protein